MGTTGLIAAMSLESEALLRCIKSWKRVSQGSKNWIEFEAGGQRCLLATSGMGVRKAADTARMLLEATPLNRLISFGIAGAVEPGLEIGDVIVVEAVCQWHDGVASPPVALQRFTEEEFEAASKALASRGSRMYRGTAVTTGSYQPTTEQLAGLEHPILEMETAALAKVASDKGVPVSAIRAISDGPAAPIPFNLSEMVDENANVRYGKILVEIVRHPRIMSGLRDIMKNSRIAADNAARAVIEMISTCAVN